VSEGDPAPDTESPETDPEQPIAGRALSLTEYFRNLDDWAAERSCRQPWVGELIEARGFGVRERSEYTQGASALWRLIPPITIEEVTDNDLDPQALMALGLALVLKVRQELSTVPAFEPGEPLPEPLHSLERLARFVSEQIEQAGRKANQGAIARLAALRGDLQELRAFRDESVKDGAEDYFTTPGGVASARRGLNTPVAAKLFGFIPRRVRAITAPGVSAIRRATEPGLRMLGLGEAPAEVFEHDEQVPAPLGLYQYVAALDNWAAERAMDEPFMAGLLTILGYGKAERKEFEAGRSRLWSLVPPIQSTDIAEADLDVASARALALVVVFWGRHVLAYYPPGHKGLPPLFGQAGEMVAALRLVLDSVSAQVRSRANKRLYELGFDLEERGVTSISALDERRSEVMEAHRREVVSRRHAEESDYERARRRRLARIARGGQQISYRRAFLAVVLLITAIATWTLYPGRSAKIPPAASYHEVPIVAIVRLQDVIRVRVDRAIMDQPAEERSTALVALWEHFGREVDGDPIDVDLVDRKGEPLGGVKVGEAWWVAPDEPEQSPAGEPVEDDPPAGTQANDAG